ncbi:MAG: FAD-binding protein [Vicinamibacterales bacterium]
MATTFTNYDGSISCSPRAVAYPTTITEIQAVMRDSVRYPSPVRAMGSHHSLTPCAVSDGTVVNMSRMTRVIAIDPVLQTITAEAGLQYIDANAALRKQNLQFILNIEIGNMTLGSAATCHTKDALDGRVFGQVGSYVTRVKWVDPTGELREASEDESPDLLRNVRTSYGLCGVVYEVTLRVKPIEAAQFHYLLRPVDELTESEVAGIIDRSEGLVCWTLGRTSVFQTKTRIDDPSLLGELQARGRRALWNNIGALWARAIAQYLDGPLEDLAQDQLVRLSRMLFSTLEMTGGLHIMDPDKTIDYRHTEKKARYAFTFWAFPRARWLSALREYLDFADAHRKRYGFRCNMPLGSYYVRQDDHALLSYSGKGEIFSLDPIHAPTDQAAWDRFLKEFNEWAAQRGGIPLLNQSPFVTRAHCEQAYRERWTEFGAWVRSVDPGGRMLTPFFRDLLLPA